ncbi:Uncharacterized protein QTN25_005026 [Entamoeba marina]
MLLLAILIQLSVGKYLRSCTYTNSNCSHPVTCEYIKLDECLYSSSISTFTMAITHYTYIFTEKDGLVFKQTYPNDNCYGMYQPMGSFKAEGTCQVLFGFIHIKHDIVDDVDQFYVGLFDNIVITKDYGSICNKKTSIQAYYPECIDNLDGTSTLYKVEDDVFTTYTFKDSHCSIEPNVYSQQRCNVCLDNEKESIHLTKKIIC